MARVKLLFALALPLVGACGFSVSGGDSIIDGGGPGSDGDVAEDDAMPDSTPGPICLGTLPHVCMDTVPATMQVPSGILTIDTNAPAVCATTAMETAQGFCVIAASEITLDAGASIVAIGPKPLVLFAPGGITISATALIDVASHDGQPEGAGATSIQNAANCSGVTLAGMGGGGSGGSFGGSGGNGGSGRTGAGTAGGAGPAIAAFPALRAGCAGAGGVASPGGTAGAGGAGGGAVSLVAGSITIDGTIRATGAPGKGGVANASGAGGGGSGGAIVLDSTTIMVGGSAILLAQGSAGGEGSGMNQTTGAIGGEASVVNQAAVGGAGSSNVGGDGGNGSTNAGGATGTAGSTGGGGGGGGGSGVIKYTSAQAPTGGAVSPPFTDL